MAVTDRLSTRDAKRLQTRERLMGAAIGEFKRSGMVDADVSTIVAAAGVAHGTFFFHFPTKEHVMLELERREEDRMAKHFGRFLTSHEELPAALKETVRLLLALERRLGNVLFKDFLALHFSQTRPPQDGRDHPLIVLVAQQIDSARERGETDPSIVPMNIAVFFLLGLYALAITTSDWPTRRDLLEDFVLRTLRSIQPL